MKGGGGGGGVDGQINFQMVQFDSVPDLQPVECSEVGKGYVCEGLQRVCEENNFNNSVHC